MGRAPAGANPAGAVDRTARPRSAEAKPGVGSPAARGRLLPISLFHRRMRSIERLRRIQPSAAIGVAALAVVATLVAAGGLGRAAFPGRNGRVSFTSNRTGHYQVFTMRPDGSHVRQLTHRGFCSEPSFSGNGRSIAFADDKDVFTMHADGTHVHRVTHTAAGVIAGNPTFTPSGHRIAYMADPAGPTRNQIFAIDTNGSHRHALTPATVDSETPSASPTGHRSVNVGPPSWQPLPRR